MKKASIFPKKKKSDGNNGKRTSTAPSSERVVAHSSNSTSSTLSSIAMMSSNSTTGANVNNNKKNRVKVSSMPHAKRRAIFSNLYSDSASNSTVTSLSDNSYTVSSSSAIQDGRGGDDGPTPESGVSVAARSPPRIANKSRGFTATNKPSDTNRQNNDTTDVKDNTKNYDTLDSLITPMSSMSNEETTTNNRRTPSPKRRTIFQGSQSDDSALSTSAVSSKSRTGVQHGNLQSYRRASFLSTSDDYMITPQNNVVPDPIVSVVSCVGGVDSSATTTSSISSNPYARLLLPTSALYQSRRMENVIVVLTESCRGRIMLMKRRSSRIRKTATAGGEGTSGGGGGGGRNEKSKPQAYIEKEETEHRGHFTTNTSAAADMYTALSGPIHHHNTSTNSPPSTSSPSTTTPIKMTPTEAAMHLLKEELSIHIPKHVVQNGFIGQLFFTFEQDARNESIFHVFHVDLVCKAMIQNVNDNDSSDKKKKKKKTNDEAFFVDESTIHAKPSSELVPIWIEDWDKMPLDQMYAADALWLLKIIEHLKQTKNDHNDDATTTTSYSSSTVGGDKQFDGWFHCSADCNDECNRVLHSFISSEGNSRKKTIRRSEEITRKVHDIIAKVEKNQSAQTAQEGSSEQSGGGGGRNNIITGMNLAEVETNGEEAVVDEREAEEEEEENEKEMIEESENEQDLSSSDEMTTPTEEEPTQESQETQQQGSLEEEPSTEANGTPPAPTRDLSNMTLEKRLFHEIHGRQINNPSIKEFKECWAFVNATRTFYGKKSFDVVLDVAGGHGALGALFLILTSAKRAVVIDPADVGRNGVQRAWGSYFEGKELKYRYECLRTGLRDELQQITLNSTTNIDRKRVLVVACHACQHLSDETLEIASSFGVHVTVMPCCQKDLNGSYKAFAKQIGVGIGPIMDIVAAGKMMSWENGKDSGVSYQVKMKAIDEKITPQNRLILCKAIDRSESTSEEEKMKIAQHKKLEIAYRKAHDVEGKDHDKPSTDRPFRLDGLSKAFRAQKFVLKCLKFTQRALEKGSQGVLTRNHGGNNDLSACRGMITQYGLTSDDFNQSLKSQKAVVSFIACAILSVMYSRRK